MLYVALRRMAINGKVYEPGDESDLEGVSREYLAYILGRRFWLVIDGEESLDEELFLMVMEERD